MNKSNLKLLSGSTPNSFAFITLTERIPRILTKVIDSLTRMETRLESHERNDLINFISALKYDITRNKVLKSRFETGDESKDFASDSDLSWKYAIDLFPESSRTWLGVSWLLSEQLVYKHLEDAAGRIVLSLAEYDMFYYLKKESLEHGLSSMDLAAKQLLSANQKEKSIDTLGKMLQFSLWGNQADLSLTFETAKIHQEANKRYTIVDDSQKATKLLSAKRITIILDNAGFELFSDLVLATFLTLPGVVIILECKKHPWFVSDTVKQDFEVLFHHLENFSDVLKDLVAQWRTFLLNKVWIIRDDPFWTSHLPFWHLPEAAIFPSLCESDFLIFKGDLNYRKMVCDAIWDKTTSFQEAIGPLKGSKIPPFLMLRTLKADVAVGLKQGQEEELNEIDENWMICGKFGVIQGYFLQNDLEDKK